MLIEIFTKIIFQEANIKKFYIAIFSIALMFLAGCGGGGGESSDASDSVPNSKGCVLAELESAFPTFEGGGSVYCASFSKDYDGELSESVRDNLINKGFTTISGGLRRFSDGILANITTASPLRAMMTNTDTAITFGDSEFDSVFGEIKNAAKSCKLKKDFGKTISGDYPTYENALEDAGFKLAIKPFRLHWKKIGDFYYMSYAEDDTNSKDYYLSFEAVKGKPCFVDNSCI